MKNESVYEILNATTAHPMRILGPQTDNDKVEIRCFFPDASSAKVKFSGNKGEVCGESIGSEGFFVFHTAFEKVEEVPAYEFVLDYPDGNKFICRDAYAVKSEVDSEALDDFQKGINYEIYEVLGAKPCKVGKISGTRFMVWAPNAISVSIVGDFNLWDERRHLMEKDEKYGVFHLFVPDVSEGAIYKYSILGGDRKRVLKSDPFGTSAQKRPDNASIVFDIDHFKWTDKKWISEREKANPDEKPMNIYEMHLGSWKKPTEEDGSFYNYRELAPMICEYVKDMGYTHVELLPIMEHPFDGSWGYQVTGYYAVTSRFGTPADFMWFVDYLHNNGIGVILDWVPAHFPKDAFGLARFDGTCLFEHGDPRKGEHPDWGTLIFNLERHEVSNFLIANALYWVERFHADGIRMDAVASMLYLDYGRKAGEWLPNRNGGRENLDSVEFLKHLNSIMNQRNKNVLMIAEESTAWPNVTGDVRENNSLGFSMKWNMGWMNDFLKYMQQDPLFKKGVHGCLTFSMMYAYSEKFILVLSHDEVVHGKGSLVNKMPGTYEEKFANLRAALGFMIGHPGKKLLFMGQDFAQFAEWNENKSLDWMLPANYEMHDKFQNYCRELNKIYINNPALYELDYNPEGFTWMSCMDADHSIVSFIRKAKDGKKFLFVVNFTPIVYEGFVQAVPEKGKYKEILNSDSVKFGGTGHVNPRVLSSKAEPKDGQENTIKMTLPPLGICIFEVK